MKVLVTGASGQVGQALQSVASEFSDFNFHFASSSEVDITDIDSVSTAFEKFKPDFCINAAAYTAVDKAQSEPEKATLLNRIGAKNIAIICAESNTILLHISTDFVFDGNKTTPYSEQDLPNPESVYGQTKFEGEREIERHLNKHIIVRTSWIYSEFGNNFMKTIMRLAKERTSLSVVNDQIGSPTNAVDLAKALLTIIRKLENISEEERLRLFGIYNFSSEGAVSWYEFARKIFEINKITIDLQPIPTEAFPTAAKRPKYSVLDKRKIKNVFGVDVLDWEESLQATL